MQTVEFRLPSHGDDEHEAEVVKWLVEEGEYVREMEPIVEVQTDKAVIELPSPITGRVRDILAAAGSVARTGDVLAVLEPATPVLWLDGRPVYASPANRAEPEPEADEEPASDPMERAVQETARGDAPPGPTEEAGAGDAGLRAEPAGDAQGAAGAKEGGASRAEAAAQRGTTAGAAANDASSGGPEAPGIAARETGPEPARAERGADAAVSVQEARGPEPSPIAPWVEPPSDSLLWRMVRNAERSAQRTQRKRWQNDPEDDAVLRPFYPGAKPAAEEQPERRSTRVPFRGVRRATAEHVTRSAFTAPHVTVFDECEATELIALRQRWNRVLEPEGQRVSYLPFLVKATVSALKAVPYMNARLDEAAHEIELIANYHIGIAVETPEGLYVPVIRHADRLTVREIGEEIFRLRQAARERTLGQQDLHGSTFTITNMGPIGGGLFATPIINYPEVGILGVHQIQRKPVVRGDEVVIRDMIAFSLSFDHRVIDGVTAVRFLNHLKNLVEHPELLMLEMK
ncbi:dihydrolipoamide acetyltransferase family protein [Alicyclobacillus sp.]|uniref:dihydrolipoamide acetyltransferase family protein n=1 Tax=Alicyclobacillus sp. TaxID=61169 RepID=UPI0025BFFF7F|nr:dihydrolipoamide acetyltransferase family protein [Alicyclobacillus sp.]MCL6516679.1 2-oxo acid dehydrogenase subunit E2 [Alicyclobacillus sp.]